MKTDFFEVLRAGINSTFQDQGRENFYHIGIPFSGAMDNRNFVISNALVNNEDKQGVIEFAYQGPLFEFNGENISFSITGDVKFKIIKKDNTIIDGECYKSYILNHKDKLDIISTNKSIYGYLAVSGGFSLDKILNSYSTFSRANVGPYNLSLIHI